MKAVISVLGRDMVGILARVSTICANANANVLEVTQSIIDKYFAMYMMVDITDMTVDLEKLRIDLREGVPEMEIHVMHEDILNSMHKI